MGGWDGMEEERKKDVPEAVVEEGDKGEEDESLAHAQNRQGRGDQDSGLGLGVDAALDGGDGA